METWEDIKKEFKLDYIKSLKNYRKNGIDTYKLTKMYLQSIKNINEHIKNNDILTIIDL